MAEFTDFCSPAYKLETVNAECSRMVNWYLEVIEKGPRAGKLRMRSTPGLRTFSVLPTEPLRSLLRIDGGNRCFAVGGSKVYEVFADGSNRPLNGEVAASTRPAIMVSNGFQLLIASGGYLYLAEGGDPGTVSPVNFTDGTPVRAATIDFLKQFVVAALLDSKQLVCSDVAPNGGLWDPGDTALKEGYPDNIARVFAHDQQLYLYGFDTTEPWVGNPAVGGFPFTSQNLVLNYGTVAPFSIAKAGRYRFWLWGHAVYMGVGPEEDRVSDFGVEEAIKSYGDVSDAEGFCQIDGGHTFYFISFPGADRTWVYDVSTKSWHERLYFSEGKYSRFRGRVYAHAFRKHLIGDYQNGFIYEMTPEVFRDAQDVPVRRQRTCPYITDHNRNIRYNQLTLDMDTGIGLPVGGDAYGIDPQVILRYSDDRGKTWGNELQESAGAAGETFERVIFNQLGASRLGKVFEVIVTDPVPWAINTAYLKVGDR